MQVCTLFQTDNHASTSPLSFFTGQMPFLPPNQQRQSNEDSGHLSEETELISTAEVTDADRWAEQQTVLLYMIDT